LLCTAKSTWSGYERGTATWSSFHVAYLMPHITHPISHVTPLIQALPRPLTIPRHRAIAIAR
jgi:hypothetical protein